MATCCKVSGKCLLEVRRKILSRDLCFSGMLITDVSGELNGPIFKGTAGGPAGPLKTKLAPWRKPETTQILTSCSGLLDRASSSKLNKERPT